MFPSPRTKEKTTNIDLLGVLLGKISPNSYQLNFIPKTKIF